jgi:hypothetical protein
MTSIQIGRIEHGRGRIAVHERADHTAKRYVAAVVRPAGNDLGRARIRASGVDDAFRPGPVRTNHNQLARPARQVALAYDVRRPGKQRGHCGTPPFLPAGPPGNGDTGMTPYQAAAVFGAAVHSASGARSPDRRRGCRWVGGRRARTSAVISRFAWTVANQRSWLPRKPGMAVPMSGCHAAHCETSC